VQSLLTSLIDNIVIIMLCTVKQVRYVRCFYCITSLVMNSLLYGRELRQNGGKCDATALPHEGLNGVTRRRQCGMVTHCLASGSRPAAAAAGTHFSVATSADDKAPTDFQ